jgi:HSP20 family protein
MPALLEKKEVRPVRALTFFDQLRDEMDRMFEGLPFARTGMPLFKNEMSFVPTIEVQEKNGVLLVKADLPGLKKEEVNVEITPEGLALAGERKSEVKEEKPKEGYFRTERTYGEFYRFVPLPEGAMIEKAIATFKDGVLEVQVPLPKLEKKEAKKLPIL